MRARRPQFGQRMRALVPGSRTGRVWMVVAVGALALSIQQIFTGPTVGHFRSAEAQLTYQQAYDRAMQEMPKAQETLDIRTSYGIVRVYRFKGENDGATPLLLLPGTQSGTPVWADNLPDLLKHRSVYALDLLGEPGMSVQSRPITDSSDKAAWLGEVLENLPEPDFHVVGLSIGGWTATNLALHNSDRIASLSLIEPVMVFTGLSGGAIIRSIPASVHWFPKSWRDSFSSWTAGGAPVEDIPVAKMIGAGMHSYTMAQPGPKQITAEELAGLNVPSLVIIAGDSPMHDPATLRGGAKHLPDARVLTYSGASHAINGEEPARLARNIGSFIDEIEQ